MKRTKLTSLKVSSFLTNIRTGNQINLQTVKGGFHDGPTGCICTAGVSCQEHNDIP